MATQVKLRRDTDANWTTNSTVVLAEGEVGVNLTNGQFKLGNGSSTWAQLTYFQPGAPEAASINNFGEGFSLTTANKIVTNKLYSTNLTQPTQHYRLEVDTNGVVILPDQSIINGATLKTVPGNYAGITAGPAGKDEDSWMWVDNDGATIATKYSTDAFTWHFDNTGKLTLPAGGDIVDNTGTSVLGGGGGNANTGNITFNGDNIGSTNDTVNIVGNNYAQLQSANTYMWVEDGEADIEVNGNTWVFNDSGYMEIPNEGLFGAVNASILAFSSQNNKPIFIEVIDTGNSAARQWVFDNSGNLTLPGSLINPDGFILNAGGRGSLAIGKFIEAPGVDEHFHIAFPDSNVEVPYQDLYLGNDFNYVKIRGSHNEQTMGVDIGVEGQRWEFNPDGSVTFPDATVQTTAYTGGAGGDSLTSVSSIQVETGDSDRWFVRLRREDETQDPSFKGVTVYSTNYDSAGNAIVVAKITLDNEGVAVFKFTSAGDLVWKKSMGSINNSSYTFPESNVVIDTSNNILFAINQDDSQAKIIIKLNGATGAVLFSKVLALTQNYHIKGMALDSANNIIIGGDFYFSGPDEWTGFVAKLNPTANSITWQKSLTVDSGYSYINSVAVDFNNNIIAVGSAEVEHTVNGSTITSEEMLVAKITSVGGLAWQKSVSIDSETPYGRASNVSLDSVGNIYVTGTYYVDNATNSTPWSGQKSNAVVLFKMTTLGVIAWDRRVGPGECSWVGVSTAVGDDGDLYLYASTYQLNPAGQTDSTLGYWNATLALARYNKTTGAVVWQSYFDNPNAQEIPGEGNDSPFNGQVTDLMAVKGNKILIGGSVRLGADGISLAISINYDYFTQGFIAQFDTAATPWSAEGWTLSTSRIPGRLMNTLTAVTGPTALQTDIAMTAEGAVMLSAVAVGVSVRRTASKVNTWTFGKDGTFSAPADADIRLNQRQLGYATMYGVFPNNDDDIWFETVCHDADGFAYAVGSDWYGGDRAHIYKFTPEGAAVWSRQLRSGSGALFEVVVTSGVYAVPTVTSGGEGYKVGDRIILSGYNLGGNASNTLVLEVAALGNSTDYVGEVATVTIVSGVGASGVTNTFNSVQDYYDDAECEVRSMAYNPVTGNIEVIITTQTTLGDPTALNLDIDWSETVIVTIDSGSGTVVSTRTLRDEGDVYAYDTAVSSTGKIAVVGEKFNEYNEYGSITPLAGSAVDKLWVSKADIDAEHFPGESIPGGSYYQDWWITGTGITDQIRVTGVNYYTGLATSSNSVDGRDATITVGFDATTGVYDSHIVPANGIDYSAGDTITISGLLLAGGTTPANNIVFTVNSVLAGGGVNTGSISWTSGAHPATHLQITTSASVNFAAGGAAFAIKQNLGGEAFVWTPDFTKAIGGAVSDVFSGVVWNAAGTSLYAVGRGRYEVNYDQALVVKFSSTGTVTASKFINDNMGENDAYDGAVALMANDSIVVVHDQYNNERDKGDEVLVTKLDSSLNIVWQQFIGVNTDPNGNNWYSPNNKISVAVDPATDEILLAWNTYNNDIFGDDAIYLVKLDTDGEVLWKRIWGVHESDTRMCYTGYGNKAVSIHGDQFTLVGHTDAPDDDYDNGFIVTLPLDGTGLGEHGIWIYAEPKDDIVKVWRLSGRTATVFTATEHTGGITAVANIKHYYTDYPSEEFTFYPETILSNQGGAVEFADGSRQTFSTALVPQVKISAGRYVLRPEDSGRHILIETSNYSVTIPYWQKVSLPVGYTVTLVNISGNDAYVQCEQSNNYRGVMWHSGNNMKTPGIGFADNGSGQMITLIKIKEGTKSDDSENHGDIWMVAGADIINDD